MSEEQGDLFGDLPEGRRRRDEGMERVGSHNKRWMRLCIDAVTDYAMKTEHDFTGEDLRFYCIGAVGYPMHHNAWGSLTNQLIKHGIIIDTGDNRPMRDKRSHARRTPVYRAAR